ncbi:hypothetical protein A2880_03410 [Candidatus Peribacteria bacterium RIFCSPHIGHO2_01_FULL_49_38]|nr:MAG: hypothetical protein A2880_03410 [Candidatus Peribacteria bacterium RIFCSPHIGHO2_01_FULL_49_38]
MTNTKQTRRNVTQPERAILYAYVGHKDQKTFQRKVVTGRAFCAGRGVQVARVFAGIEGARGAHNPYLALRRPLNFCNVKKNGISMMVIPDFRSIPENADTHSLLSASHYDLQRNGITLQTIDYHPNEV